MFSLKRQKKALLREQRFSDPRQKKHRRCPISRQDTENPIRPAESSRRRLLPGKTGGDALLPPRQRRRYHGNPSGFGTSFGPLPQGESLPEKANGSFLPFSSRGNPSAPSWNRAGSNIPSAGLFVLRPEADGIFPEQPWRPRPHPLFLQCHFRELLLPGWGENFLTKKARTNILFSPFFC